HILENVSAQCKTPATGLDLASVRAGESVENRAADFTVRPPPAPNAQVPGLRSTIICSVNRRFQKMCLKIETTCFNIETHIFPSRQGGVQVHSDIQVDDPGVERTEEQLVI